jgi:hypothetical protein
VDTHLGRLAKYLRLLGFDAVYQNNSEDKELAYISHHEQRILLTRDSGLLKRSEVIYGYFVRFTNARQQAAEVVRRFDLLSDISPFRRCLRCNSLLSRIAKEAVIDRLAPNTRQHFDDFRTCPTCNRIYWAGSHYEQMQRFVQRILAR